MKATIQEMHKLLQENNRQAMEDYLLSHKPESREEMETYEKLRNKEFSLRKTSTKETKKTENLLKNSPRNKENGQMM